MSKRILISETKAPSTDDVLAERVPGSKKLGPVVDLASANIEATEQLYRSTLGRVDKGVQSDIWHKGSLEQKKAFAADILGSRMAAAACRLKGNLDKLKVYDITELLNGELSFYPSVLQESSLRKERAEAMLPGRGREFGDIEPEATEEPSADDKFPQ